MRVLAIRGKNLASLAREFEVDFSHGPLAQTGIFAITGPTGAGKSTLLDALCLALYDDMPRLPREGFKGLNLPDVAGETIAPRDPRSILRRGAAEGFAEVDFVGNDGLTYRARWSVRRARNKAEGKLQQADMSLLLLPEGSAVGGARKTEILPAISERIGLSFEQFTRAVLLAQNEFSAFLKASDDKRAELLQTLTGTDQFTALSQRAFARARQLAMELQALRERIRHIEPLALAARAALEQEQNAAQGQLQVLEGLALELEQQWRWHQQALELQQAVQAAQQMLQQAEAAKAALHERHALLLQVESVQVARPLLVECDRLDHEVLLAKQAVQLARQQLQEAEQHWAAGQAAVDVAKQHKTRAEQAQQLAQPQLAAAHALDIQLATLLPPHRAAQQAVQSAATAQQQVQQALLAQQQAQQQLNQQHTELEAWLASHAALRPLAGEWGQWQTLLVQAGEALQEQGAVGARLAGLQHQLAAQQEQQAQAQQQFTRSEAACQQQQRAVAEAQQAYAAFDPDALAHNRTVLDQQHESLRHGQQVWQVLASTAEGIRNRQAKQVLLQTETQQLRQHLAGLQAQQPVVERACQQAEQSVRLAEQACHAQVESLRASLEADSPCPVCGALEHPYAQQTPAFNALLDSLRQAWQQQRQTVAVLDKDMTSTQTRLEGLNEQQQVLVQALATEEVAYALQQTAWQDYLLSQGLAPAGEQDWSVWFTGQLAGVRAALAQWVQTEQACRLASQQLEMARQQQAEALATHTQLQQQLSLSQAAVQESTQAIGLLTSQQVQLGQRLAGLLEPLASVLSPVFGADWQDQWRANPDAFRQRCQADVGGWLSQAQAAEQVRQQSLEGAAALARLELDTLQASRHYEQASQQFVRLDADVQAKQGQRAALFNGQAVSGVEAQLQADLAQALEKLEVAQGQLAGLQVAQVRALEALHQAEAVAGKRQAEAHTAHAQLQAWLVQAAAQVAGLDKARLREWLAYGSDWIATGQQVWQQAGAALAQAQTVLHERESLQFRHAQQRSGDAPLEQVQAQLASNQQALAAARLQAQGLALALRDDDHKRGQAVQLQADIAQQEQHNRVWDELNELIGSADGKKFRNFAQQYSLDVLLGYANHHLKGLSRRYVLQRVPDSLALLVLDQDMGSEARSVHSLSGGESFLVSLALALGLASLSSHRVRVESLFIDEGFGSLDADSLAIAMDALDSLQAQGRKVGVISHVQEMTERIGVQVRVQRLSGGQSRVVVG